MLGDCHVHMVLDGRLGYREAMDRHKGQANEAVVRDYLKQYQKAQMEFVRDGGDKYGASLLAKKLAPEYGLHFVTPGFPIFRNGLYGGFIGKGFSTIAEYRSLLAELKDIGADFVKLMLSGILDFSEYGKLSCDAMDTDTILETIRIAHEEGFAVMVHCNGADAASAAIEAGAESLEHGFYLDNETMHQLAESDTVWVPTVVTVGNLLQDDRYPKDVTKRIFEEHIWHVSTVAGWGGNIALGSDAGAYLVPHIQGALDEYDILKEELGDCTDSILQTGECMIRWKFSGEAI